MKIELERFYLIKPNKKLRPIGSPDLYSKMIGKAFSDMVIAIHGPDLLDTHHGFLPNRGIHTAAINIMCNYYELGMKNIYEFDLRSGFNRVNPSGVRAKLSEKSETLAGEIYRLIHNTTYKGASKLEQESELTGRGHIIINKVGKPLIERCGLPQGLPMSPVLSILAIANVASPKGLVMYADDGVLMTKHRHDFRFFDEIAKVGAEIAEEKSKLIDGSMKFVGLTFDFENHTVTGKESTFEYIQGNAETAMDGLSYMATKAKLEIWRRR